LARTCGADEQDVGLVELYLVVLYGRCVDTLVVVVHRDRQRFLGLFLTDDVLVQDVLDFLRRGNLRDRIGYLALFILLQNLVAESDALVADVDRWPGDEFPDRVLGLAAERAA